MFHNEENFNSIALDRLIKKAEDSQWSLERDIDWSQKVILPDGVSEYDYLDMVSQLYYGEVLTLHILAKMLMKLPDFQAKKYISTQIYEETRHAEAYLKYIKLIGKLHPVNKNLEKVFMQAINWEGSVFGLVVALNILFEGEALQLQQKRLEIIPCPLFKDIIKKITLDESRHASFGMIYLKEKLPTVPQEEKNQISQWVFSMWKNWESANEGRYEDAEVLQADSSEFAKRLKVQTRILENIGLIQSEKYENAEF